MKVILIILFSIVIVAGQLTIAPRLNLFGAVPNFILALSVAWAIYKKDKKNSWLILIPAVLQEILIGRPLGLIILSLWLSFSLVGWLGSFLFKQSGLGSLIVLSLIGVLFYDISFFGLDKIAVFFNLAGVNSLALNFYPTVLVAVIYDCLLCILIFFAFKKFLPSLVNLSKKIMNE